MRNSIISSVVDFMWHPQVMRFWFFTSHFGHWNGCGDSSIRSRIANQRGLTHGILSCASIVACCKNLYPHQWTIRQKSANWECNEKFFTFSSMISVGLMTLAIPSPSSRTFPFSSKNPLLHAAPVQDWHGNEKVQICGLIMETAWRHPCAWIGAQIVVDLWRSARNDASIFTFGRSCVWWFMECCAAAGNEWSIPMWKWKGHP